ncbi:MAG: class I SAM-dependent methyltransferase, partial [Sphingorhabdus sp.]
ATGIDIDPERIKEANANAQKEGVTELVDFRQADLFTSDFSDASVITLYLLDSLNEKLRPKLLAELKPGTRIVSHAFTMGDWKPEQTRNVNGRMVYMWTIPAR